MNGFGPSKRKLEHKGAWLSELERQVPRFDEAEVRAVFDFFDSGSTGQIDKTEFFQVPEPCTAS